MGGPTRYESILSYCILDIWISGCFFLWGLHTILLEIEFKQNETSWKTLITFGDKKSWSPNGPPRWTSRSPRWFVGRHPMITHTADSHWTQSQSYKFKKFGKNSNFANFSKSFTHNTPLRCRLIRCICMKWIQWVWIQSGHDSVHTRTDRRTENVKPAYPFQLCWSRGYNDSTVDPVNH